jgi:hypothetical protein
MSATSPLRFHREIEFDEGVASCRDTGSHGAMQGEISGWGAKETGRSDKLKMAR